MALGDETILGAFDNNVAGLIAAGAAMDTATVAANDKFVVIMGAGNLQFNIIHIEGV